MNLVIGKEYKVKNFKSRPEHWNFNGEMDQYMGTVVVINRILPRMRNPIKLVEDKGAWSWQTSDLEELEFFEEKEFLL